MTNKTRYIPLLLLLLLFSCTSQEERELSSLLNRADSLMRTRPDSSLYILNKVEAPSTTSLSMRHALLRADALNKCDSVLPSDTLLRELADYYDRHGSANERMRAHYLLGRCYHDMGEAPHALECYQHAAEQADTTREDCDLYTLRAIYGQMADLYHFENLPTNEIKALASCEKVAWKSKDTLTALRCRELQIRPYYLLGDTTKVLQIVSYMNRIYKENGLENFAVSAYPVSIFIYIKRGNYAKAREQMNAYETQSGFFDKTKNINRGREHYYYSKGLYYIGVHRIDSAEYYFRKVGQAGFQKECYKGLLEVYRHHVQPDSVSKYSQLYEAALDTLHNQMRTETVGNITSLYNYNRSTIFAQQQTIKLGKTRIMAGIIITVIVLISIVIFMHYRHVLKTKTQAYMIISDKLADVEIEKESISELLKMRIKHQNDLIAKMKNSQDYMSEQIAQMQQSHEEEVKRLQEEEAVLSESEKRLRNELKKYCTHSTRNAMLKDETVQYFTKFKSPNHHLKMPSKRDWLKLKKVFENYRLEFSSISKELTDNELYTYMLLELGIPNKNIANLLNVSPQRITQLKQQIQEKVSKQG